MGRFYKTSKPEMLDFMYKLPEQAILGAVKSADAKLDAQSQYLTDLQKQLQVNALSWDKEKKDAKVKEYEDLVKQHTYNIYNNPLAALNEVKGIRELGTTIHEDLTRGELFAYKGNYDQRAKYYEEAKKRATDKEGKIRIQDLNTAMEAFDLKYGGVDGKTGANYDKTTGKYNVYGTEDLTDYFDVSKYAKETAEGWVSHQGSNWNVSSDGMYWHKQEKKYDILGLDELTMGIYSTARNNENLVDHNVQKMKIEAQREAFMEAQKTGAVCSSMVLPL